LLTVKENPLICAGFVVGGSLFSLHPEAGTQGTFMELSAGDRCNQQMVDRLIAEGTLWSLPLIAAFRATPRHHFLNRIYQFHRKSGQWREIIVREPDAAELRLLYSDRALITRISPAGRHTPAVPISSSSQPSLMAQMLEDLKLGPGLKILEVGAGTGYNSALLAHVAGPGQIISVDVDKEVLAESWDHFRAYGDRKVQLQHADGRNGYADAAPYDRIMVTAATPDIEPAWLDQLADRGLLLAPLVLAPGLAYVVRGTVADGCFHGRLTRAAYFMPLRAEGESGSGEDESPGPATNLRSFPAPWAGWFDGRRIRLHWMGFIQSLAFYGLLRGLAIHYQMLDRSPAVFGVSRSGDGCWFGHQEWQVNNDAGRDLGWFLWRAFLDSGGPWPTEFRLKACPGDSPLASRRESYLRQGPRCRQLWELSEPRDRGAWL
jgi:protein-L-isoaspartate(D-aspartate) O-methyltransferase